MHDIGDTTHMAKMQVLIEFWEFLHSNKKYWLLPIVIVLVLAGLLIVLTQGSAVAPFIYTVF
ncbi:MAG: DUF5989 family protein [Vicinamibacterales bacterium]|nr:DUF5989 family protein [Vicinamibacterales bacterium]